MVQGYPQQNSGSSGGWCSLGSHIGIRSVFSFRRKIDKKEICVLFVPLRRNEELPALRQRRGAEVTAVYHSIINTVKLQGRSTWDYLGKFFTGIFNGCRDFFESVTAKYRLGCMSIVKNLSNLITFFISPPF